MSAVDEHGELHPLRPPIVEQRLDRRPHGPAREQHVVNDHDRQAGDVEVDVGGVQNRGVGPARQIVAVEADVEIAEGNLCAEQVLEHPVQATGENRAAPVDADECREPERSELRSMISCAMRVSARSISSSWRTTFSAIVRRFLPGLSGPD